MASPSQRGVDGPLGPGPLFIITQPADGVTFANVWTTADAEEQRQLVEAMNADVPGLAANPGFISMAVLQSTDGEQVVVLAQWTSVEAFDAAITHDEAAMTARKRLELHGRSSAHIHEVAGVYGPGAAAQ